MSIIGSDVTAIVMSSVLSIRFLYSVKASKAITLERLEVGDRMAAEFVTATGVLMAVDIVLYRLHTSVVDVNALGYDLQI